MKVKITNYMGTGKNKIAMATMCGALILTLGSSTVFAASAADKGSIKVKNENGVMSYSTDDGQTWNAGVPDGAVIKNDSDGQFISMGELPAEGHGKGLMVKNENGNKYYSTDGGETWSENAPDGLDLITSEDGSVGIKNHGALPDGEKGSMMVKNYNGIMSYSTDDGQTWNTGAPDGATIESDGNGGSFVTMGTPVAGEQRDSVAVKIEDGKMYYSADGEETWSENTP